jgi:cell division protein FtsL
MLTLDLAKIDKFVIVLAITLVAMAVIVTFAFKGIFSAYLTAYEINQSIDSDLRIEKERLEQAHAWAFSKEAVPLQMTFDKPEPKHEED